MTDYDMSEQQPVVETTTEVEALIERLILGSVGSCTSNVKSPDIEWHNPMCRYRLLVEAATEFERLRAAPVGGVR